MNGLTAPEMCELIGIAFTRFETLRRRYRASFDAETRVDGEFLFFPVKDEFSGKWARYDYDDCLRLAATVALEKRGLDFKSAAHVVVNASPLAEIVRVSGDVWFGRATIRDEEGSVAEPFVCGEFGQLFFRWAGSDADALVACNVSAIDRNLRAKLASLGYTVDGEAIAKVAGGGE